MLVILLIVVAVLNTSKAKLIITVENNNKSQVTAVTQGSDVILNCSSTARDNVSEIVWLKNDDLIENKLKALPAILVLHNASKEESNGIYTCLDKRNKESSSYNLKVDERPIISYLSPIGLCPFYFHPPIQEKTITCEASGWPTPAVYWKNIRSGETVNSSILKINENNVKNYIGSNTCYARNRAGTDKEDCYVDRTVEYTNPPAPGPKITSKKNRTVVGNTGGTVSFAVKTSRTPYNVISKRWSFGGKQLQQGLKYEISRTTDIQYDKAEFQLTVKDLSSSDSGIYKLAVFTNIPPPAEAWIKLEVRQPDKNDVATDKAVTLYPEYAKMWIPVVVSSCVAFVFVIVLGYFLVKRKKYVFFKGLKKEIPKFDVFISYSTSDFDWVRQQLIPLLAKHHIRYSIHSKDFEIGKTIVDNMADSVYMCKHIIAVLSDRYLESAFCQTELDMAICRSCIDKKPVLTIINLNCGLTKKYSKLSKQNVHFQSVQKGDDRWKEELMHYVKPSLKKSEAYPI